MSYKGFSQVELRQPVRSYFDLSHVKKLSTRMGRLTPILMQETLPNDTVKCNTEVLLKLAPLLAPVYELLNCYVHYFFVPNRLLWDEWEEFITNGRLGTETPPLPPFFQIPDILSEGEDYLDKSSTADYLGIPNIPDSDVANWNLKILHAMPFAVTYKVWYDYYRDRNYTPDAEWLPMPSGEQDPTYIPPFLSTKQRAWSHDYFNSALPWTQRGAEVLMPLAGSASVTYTDASNVFMQNGSFAEGSLGSGLPGGVLQTEDGPARIENIESVEITNSAVSINDLRQAVRLQEWLERNALAGSRYTESIRAHFGRKSSDARLQRAEYLGGGRATIQIGEVMTTAYSEDADSNLIPPAQMTGRASVYSNKNYFRYNCEEHGFIVAFMSVMPKATYMQGLPRMFQARKTFLDYAWPSFANLGEQEVYDYEIYLDPDNLNNGGIGTEHVFGYQSRYADYKFNLSTVHGDFRTSLDFWHLAQKFANPPALGKEFVEFPDELQDRIFAVAEEDNLWCLIHHDMGVTRTLPYFGTPRL